MDTLDLEPTQGHLSLQELLINSEQPC